MSVGVRLPGTNPRPQGQWPRALPAEPERLTSGHEEANGGGGGRRGRGQRQEGAWGGGWRGPHLQNMLQDGFVGAVELHSKHPPEGERARGHEPLVVVAARLQDHGAPGREEGQEAVRRRELAPELEGAGAVLVDPHVGHDEVVGVAPEMVALVDHVDEVALIRQPPGDHRAAEPGPDHQDPPGGRCAGVIRSLRAIEPEEQHHQEATPPHGGSARQGLCQRTMPGCHGSVRWRAARGACGRDWSLRP